MNDGKDKAIVHLGPRALDINLLLPVRLTDEQAARIGFPFPTQSTYKADLQKLGRIGVPKAIREGLGLAAGDAVVVTIRSARDATEEGEEA